MLVAFVLYCVLLDCEFLINVCRCYFFACYSCVAPTFSFEFNKGLDRGRGVEGERWEREEGERYNEWERVGVGYYEKQERRGEGETGKTKG